MDVDENDQLISVLPIHYSNALASDLHIHQFPLLTRPLQAPPSGILSGKRITARIKPKARRLEIHVPIDTRPEVFNAEKAKEFGIGRLEDDQEKNQVGAEKHREDEPRPLRSTSQKRENTSTRCLYARCRKLHLHAISETHQFRPTLTYLDILSRKNRRSRDVVSDSESDGAGDADEATQDTQVKQEKKGETKEVHVAAKKSEDTSSTGGQPGMSAVRSDILRAIREETDEKWESLDFCDVTTQESSNVFENMFSRNNETLNSTTSITKFITSIEGL